MSYILIRLNNGMELIGKYHKETETEDTITLINPVVISSLGMNEFNQLQFETELYSMYSRNSIFNKSNIFSYTLSHNIIPNIIIFYNDFINSLYKTPTNVLKENITESSNTSSNESDILTTKYQKIFNEFTYTDKSTIN